jgi:hypothetical protein
LLWLIISGIWKPRLTILDTSVIDLRVLINDVDLRKVSGDRYFALADLGWGDLYIRWGAFKRVLKGECAPVGQVLSIKVRSALWLFQRFQIHTKVLWWNELWIYFEQRFMREGEAIAVCIGKGGLLKGSTLLAVSEWAPGSTTAEKPEKSETVKAIQQLEKAIQW